MVVTFKMIEEETSLLRKTELENEAFQAKILQLKLDNIALRTSKAKADEKCVRLKLELKQARVSFVKEKKLEVAYQQQVDDMFFYNYHCYMKKHGIIDDIPSIMSDDEKEVVLSKEAGQSDSSTLGESATSDDALKTHLKLLLITCFFYFHFVYRC